jgi:hypothetical protein
MQSLENFLSSFFSLEIIPGKKVRIPYWRNRLGLGGFHRIQGPYGGKGSPAQIRKATLERAKKSSLNLKKLSSSQIRRFMRQKKIGLDCSGFAFQILDFLFPGFWKGLKKAPGKSVNPIRRFNAYALTSKENSVAVKKIKDIKVGDLVPLSWQGKVDHVLTVVKVTDKLITYAHSSQKTKITGPHLGKIKIIDPKKGLNKQVWLERNKDETPISKFLTSGEARRIRFG